MNKNRKTALAVAAGLFVLQLAVLPGVAANKNLLAGSEWGTGGKQYVRFASKGQVSGSGGCNRFFGKYTSKGTQIEIGRLGSTRMHCGSKISTDERKFFGKLGSAKSVKVSHLVLKLYDSKGQLLLKLRRRDWD